MFLKQTKYMRESDRLAAMMPTLTSMLAQTPVQAYVQERSTGFPPKLEARSIAKAVELFMVSKQNFKYLESYGYGLHQAETHEATDTKLLVEGYTKVPNNINGE